MQISNNNQVSSSTNNSASSQATSAFNTDFNSFLNLLTAQLQNQDPLAPMDSSQFVSQLATLSQVEQSIKSNSNLESILAELQNSTARNDISLLGKSVSVYSDNISLMEGNAEFVYQLAEEASELKVEIKDQAGNVVKVIENPNKSAMAEHRVSWDGVADNGDIYTNDTFEIAISAKNKEDQSVDYLTKVVTKVESIDLSSITPVLNLMNGQVIESSSVVGVINS